MDKNDKKVEGLGTPLNPQYNLSIGFDSERVFESIENEVGDSVDEHSYIEEANEFIASKELGQINENS